MEEVRLDLFKSYDENDKILRKIPKELRRELVEQIGESKLKNEKRIQTYNRSMDLHDDGLGKRRLSKLFGYPTQGKPRNNCLWLSINVGSSGIPLNPIIQVPKKVNSWEDIELVISQLESKNDILPTITMEECLGFVLGMIIGDTSKPTSNRDNLALYLTKNSTTNENLGNFFCACLEKLGFKAHRVKDSRNKYKWSVQSSPFFGWIYTIGLGLEKGETTTYNSIKAGWVDASESVRKRFLQGIFESDGSVSYTGQINCSVFPNTEVIKKLLEKFEIKSYVIKDRKWNKLIIAYNSLRKCHNLLFTPEIKTERYKRLERIINAKRLKRGQKLPEEVKTKIIEMLKSDKKTYEIVKEVLLDNNYFISTSCVEGYREKFKH